MSDMPPDVPHFSFPFRLDGDHVAVDEQNTSDEIMACVSVIARCPVGFRDERPDYGWPFPEFRNVPVQPGPLEVALMRLEPRAQYAFHEYADVLSAAVRHLEVAVGTTTK